MMDITERRIRVSRDKEPQIGVYHNWCRECTQWSIWAVTFYGSPPGPRIRSVYHYYCDLHLPAKYRRLLEELEP
ncbi:hypothetical protein LCGC14_0312820 [marine sediment metagenome]|uniref:Uncharacterized protein n=1 Tax=marine sediment metagenome TaxID=412755 RepID=A0A0F9TLI9_9ZZZZ